MQSQESSYPIQDMERYFDVAIERVAEENGMMQIAYAVRALAWEVNDINSQLRKLVKLKEQEIRIKG